MVEGEYMPRGFGYAYTEWVYDRSWCAPIPLNFAIAWIRRAWFVMKVGPMRRPPPLPVGEQARWDAFARLVESPQLLAWGDEIGGYAVTPEGEPALLTSTIRDHVLKLTLRDEP